MAAETDNRKFVERLKEAKTMVQSFKTSLLTVVDPRTLSIKSKLPWKAMSLREALFYRITELGDVTCNLYENGKTIPAFILTRTALETSAMIYWLWSNIEDTIANGSVQQIDERLMKVAFGTKGGEGPFKAEPYQILKLIDYMDKKFKGIRARYDSLSEFVHPNFSGTLSAYGKVNKETLCLELGNDAGGISPLEGLPLLNAALASFKFYYDEIGKVMSRFIEV